MTNAVIIEDKYIADGLLEDYISKSGFKYSFICDKLGISVQAFYKKRIGVISFKVSEVYILCDLLHINNTDMRKIFS